MRRRAAVRKRFVRGCSRADRGSAKFFECGAFSHPLWVMPVPTAKRGGDPILIMRSICRIENSRSKRAARKSAAAYNPEANRSRRGRSEFNEREHLMKMITKSKSMRRSRAFLRPVLSAGVVATFIGGCAESPYVTAYDGVIIIQPHITHPVTTITATRIPTMNTDRGIVARSCVQASVTTTAMVPATTGIN